MSIGTGDIIIHGSKEMEDLFKKLPEKFQRKILRRALMLGALQVRERARQLVPVDSGDLKRSIKARKPKGTKRGEIRREVGATEYYAHFVESGTKKIKAQPFLKPALDETTPKIVDRIGDAMVDFLKSLDKK